MSRLYYESSFAHHGVKGQRWGVRRYQNMDGSLTSAGRRRLTKPALSKDYKTKLRTKSMISGGVIPKGTIMFRSTPNDNESLDGAKYVTYIESDRNRYRGAYAVGLRKQYGKDSTVPLYEKQFHTVEDLKIPSRETVKQVYKDVLSDPKMFKDSISSFYRAMESENKYVYFREKNVYWDSPKDVQEATEKMWKKELYKRGNESVKTYLKTYGDKSITQAFNEASTALGLTPNVKTEIIKRLSKQGYNAMVDEAGVGGKLPGWAREGVNPLIVFDGSKTLSDDKTTRINRKTENKAASKTMYWSNYVNSDEHKYNPW